jgi:hypothetical protein
VVGDEDADMSQSASDYIVSFADGVEATDPGGG